MTDQDNNQAGWGLAWRPAPPEELHLSKGPVLVRRPHVTDTILESGAVPDLLTSGALGRLQALPDNASDEDALQALGADGFEKLKPLMDALTRACLVRPRVVDKPLEQLADDEVRIGDIPYGPDKMRLLQWATGGMEGEGHAAQKFLVEHAPDLDALPDGADVRHEAERDTGTPG
jgi:hypothetical protein